MSTPLKHKYKGREDYRKGLKTRYRNPAQKIESPFQTSSKGEYSPQARAARHAKDTLIAEAMKIAHSKIMGGAVGSVQLTASDIAEAKNTRVVKKAFADAERFAKRKA
tara:strand:+ start:400 stop:723 length:324 start_codon:yes stop_codon:yes gene_type:complete